MRPLVLGALLLLAAVAPTRAARPPTAAEAVATGQALSAQGASIAAAFLKAWLARPPPSAPPLDIATVALEMARQLAAAGDPVGAGRALDQADRQARLIPPGSMAAGTVHREAARVAEAIGKYPRAASLLQAASHDFLAIAPGYAAEAENALGSIELELSRPQGAVAAFQRAIALLDGLGVPPPKLLPALVNLNKAALAAGDVDGGAAAAARALQVAGSDPRLIRAAKLAQAAVFLRQVDLPRAEATLGDVADPAIRDDISGQALLTVASSLYERGRPTEADRAGEAALDVLTSVYGPTHPAVARALHLLGLIQDLLGDTDTALAFLARAEAIQRQLFGERSRPVGDALVDRARVELDAGQTVRADGTARTALAILEALPERAPRSEGVAHAVRAVASWRFDELEGAEQQFRQSERLIVQGFGANAPELGYVLIQHGRLLTERARYADAKAVLFRALGLYDGIGGSIRLRTAEAEGALADAFARSGDRADAARHSQAAFQIVADLQRSGADLPSTDGELQQRSARQLMLDHVALLLADPAAGSGALDEAFRASQRAQQSRASEAIRLASIRLAERHDPLADLLRKRSDDADALRQAEFLLRGEIAASGTASERAQAGLRDIARQRRAALLELDGRLRRDYPQFSQFAGAAPVSLALLQQALRPGEVVLMPLVGTERTVLWAVTADAARAQLVPIARAEIRALAARIRRGVEPPPNGVAPRPFDRQASIALYQRLVEPIADLLAHGATLIYVPDDVLQSVPLPMLADADGEWLIRRIAVEVMPSVGSLLSLRGTPPAPSASRPFLGVGDPREGSVDPAGREATAAHVLGAAVRALPPLPETSDELRAMARSFPRQGSQLLLGDDATIPKLLGEDLASFKVLAFASHAVMAGELPGLPEPAILLSPSVGGDPASGLLKASQVAALDLRAELVILSACNTDAPDKGPFADGLSGLARAFLYAGSRALLVSHWRIGSTAAIPLTTRFVTNLSAAPGLGKADALRQSMLAMIDSDDETLRHPSSWAAFSLVGE